MWGLFSKDPSKDFPYELQERLGLVSNNGNQELNKNVLDLSIINWNVTHLYSDYPFLLSLQNSTFFVLSIKIIDISK